MSIVNGRQKSIVFVVINDGIALLLKSVSDELRVFHIVLTKSLIAKIFDRLLLLLN